MNQASRATAHFLSIVVTAATTLAAPSHFVAANQPALPWDYTLNVIQNVVVGPLAMFIIVISGIAAVLGFALDGDNELVRRLAKAVIGTGVALIAVQLLNYLAP